MTKQELDDEIEYIHDHRTDQKLLRPLEVMSDVILKATTSCTNLYLFMQDYIRLYSKGFISDRVYHSALNDLYLLALLHTTYEGQEL